MAFVPDPSHAPQEGWLPKERDGKQFVVPWVWIPKTDMASLAGFLSGMDAAASLLPARVQNAILNVAGVSPC